VIELSQAFGCGSARSRALRLALVSCAILTSVVVSSAHASTGFGIERYSLAVTNEDGSPDSRAGSHPYELTAEAGLAFTARSASEVRGLAFELPPGLILDPSGVSQCTYIQFTEGSCPASAAVGVLQMSVDQTIMSTTVYNLVPGPGEPAELGFTFTGIGVIVDISIRTGSDYGMTLSIHNLPQREVESVKLMLGAAGYPMFLTLPTSCAGSPQTTLQSESWGSKTASLSISFPQMTGCERLSFDPSIFVAPDTDQAGEPSGYTIAMRVPQNEKPDGLAGADLKEAVVTLPEGTGISLSVAEDLVGCSEAEAELGSPTPAMCPYASKVGTDGIISPLIEGAREKQFEGNVFLLQSNPSEPKLLVTASGDGVNFKLVGTVHLNQETGQITIVFGELPQLPIDQLKLSFVGGAFALLTNPSSCGRAVTTSELMPWSGEGAASPSSSFEVSQGANGTPCPASPSFSPVFQAGATNGEAGGYGSLSFLVVRAMQEEDLSTIAILAPQSVQEMFTGVPPCGEQQAAEGACPEASRIGGVRLTVGSGPYPYYATGGVYLTGPYRGAQQGLAIAVPFDAGPFELGTVVIRASAQVDSQTGQMTILSDPLPRVLDGIPVPMRDFELQLDRGEFRLNSDGCESPVVTGTLTSTRGATVAIATAPLGTYSTPCNPPPAVSTSKGSVSPATATVSLASTHVTTTSDREAAVKLACTGTGTCAGSLILIVKTKGGKRHRRSKAIIIGTATFSIPAGKTTTVELRVNTTGRALLTASHGRLSATLSLLESSPAPSQTHSADVRLVERKTHHKTNRR
jgi:hypothetical protein